MRQVLVDGKGNFGSADGDPPGAERYCITGDSLVRTVNGTKQIAELASVEPNSEVNIGIKVLDKFGNPALASKLFHSGNHPTLRLRTANGYEITGTLNHPLLCLENIVGVPMLLWRRLEEIQPGTRVVIARSVDDRSVEELSDRDRHLAVLTGAFVAAGFISQRRAGLNNVDKEYFDKVRTAFDVVVGGPRYVYTRPLKSGRIIHELDIHNMSALRASPLAELEAVKSGDKRIPSYIWQGSRGMKRAFLQALFEGDGSMGLSVRHSLAVIYSTQSRQLALDVQRLLLEFGVMSAVRYSPSEEIRVVVNNRRNTRLFASRVGFLGTEQALLLRRLSAIPISSRAMSRDHIPFLAEYVREECGRGGKEWLKKHNIDRIERWERYGETILSKIGSEEVKAVIRPLVESGYYYATVTSVEPAGVQPVYSIKVESDCHSFIANGFVNHNTECRLAPLAMELVRDIDEDTVGFVPNYDGRDREPVVLPARIPNLLVNGSTGIAVGMATNIPPHNLGEVMDSVVAMIDNPDVKLGEIMKILKGPDFPLGGIILGREGIKEAYSTGRGSVRVRAKCEIEETKRGPRIVVTELPYLASGDRLLEKIKELVDSKKVLGISGGRNETSRKGTRIVIELRRDAIPQVVLNNLYKHTQLQDSFGINMLALVDGVPRTLPLLDILRHYIDHQLEVVTRRTRFRLRKAEERMHILEGLLVALRHLDAVIKLIRESRSAEDAREKLMKRYKLTEIQASAILDMQLRRLAALEQQKIKQEASDLAGTIKDLESILRSPQKLRKVVKDELLEVKARFADRRRTAITSAGVEFDAEALIPDEDVIVTITRSGYIKRVKASTYRLQGRGGKGVIGAKPKEGDIVERVLRTTTHAYVLIFSNRGKVYRIKTHEIPEKDRTARGVSIRNLLPFTADESVAAMIDTRDFETHKYLVIVTKQGVIKKTAFGAYDSSRRDGIIALHLNKGDEVVGVHATSGDDELIMVSRSGMAICFNEADVRPMGRTAGGVIGMRLSKGDEVVSFDVVDPNGELLIVTDAGYGKRTLLTRYPRQRRGGKGVKTARLTDKRGSVRGASVVRVGHEVFLIASDGQVIRITVKDISRQGRDTSGVRVMRLDPGTSLAAIAQVAED
jgi:DNA gyrase subunit A